MKRKQKQLFSIILALLFCLGPLQTIAFAANSEDSSISTATVADSTEVETDEDILETEENNSDVENSAQDYSTEDQIQEQALNEVLMRSADIPSALFEGEPLESGVSEDVERYTVLVLDTSSSADFLSGGSIIYTADTALSYVKQSAKKFLEDIIDADGTNYVAIVSYKSTATVVSDFSTDIEALTTKVEALSSADTIRDMSSGLDVANELLATVNNSSARKNVVLFTTGMTNNGGYTYSGHYDEDTIGSRWRRSDTNVRLYAYANTAYNSAQNLKDQGISVYTIGLFQTMEGMPDEGKDIVEFFKLTTSDLATSEDYYYPVDDPNDLEFVFGEVADDIVNQLKEITFRYQSGSDYTAKCYYTDDYFAQSANSYNVSLATMSLSYAMSAFGSSNGGQTDYSNKSINARNLLEKIGIYEDNIEINNWFTTKPTTDSIGVIAGNKPICVNGKNYTLIAVAVRGSGYEQEWASNFTIGTSGQHEGFDTAKNNVISFLKEYVSNQHISGPVKIWITGYSRAAATANLVAGAINDGTELSSKISYIANDDVYAYCFETPAGALTSKVKNTASYGNIFNIINSSDPVPYVAPAALGFGRYGIDKYLPSAESDPDGYSDLKADMLKIYSSLDSTSTYVVDDFQMKKLAVRNWLPGGEKISFIQDDTENNYSQGTFLSNYVTILSKEFIKNRSNYVAYYQDEIREICSVVFGCTDKQAEILMESIIEQAKNEWGALAWSYVWNVGINPWGDEDDALQTVSNWLNNAVKEAGITDYDQKTIDAAGKDLGDLMLALISNHPNYFTTAVMNGGGLGAAHYPELCYAWLASMDKNYKSSGTEAFNNGGYRIVRINCEVDAKVYKLDGTLVAEITAEEPQSVENSSYISGIDQDGQKYFVLPNTGEYHIIITAREDDTVNYSISEYSALAGDFTRVVNYFDVVIKKGEHLTGYVPSYTDSELENDIPNGSSTEYTLLDETDTIIDSDADLAGDEAQDAYYYVGVTSSNPEYGIVTGAGIRQFGQFAQVEAIAFDGYKFTGWYIDEECVSTDETYRFSVTNDIEIIGKFERDEMHSHSYDTPTFNWSEDYSSCSAVFECDAGDDTQVIDCTVISETIPATNGRDGKIIYTATVEYMEQSYTDTISVSIPYNSDPDDSEHDGGNSTDNSNSNGIGDDINNESADSKGSQDSVSGNSSGSAQTGDNANLLLWFALASVSFVGIFVLIFFKKRVSK